MEIVPYRRYIERIGHSNHVKILNNRIIRGIRKVESKTTFRGWIDTDWITHETVYRKIIEVNNET